MNASHSPAISERVPADLPGMKICLWAPGGSGLHYSGPGMTAYRMYSSHSNINYELALCHGNLRQQEYPLFREQTCIYPNSSRRMDTARFVRNAKIWAKQNIQRFDVFHGLQAFHPTVCAAQVASQLGVPAFVKVAAHQADLHGSLLSRSTGILAQRLRTLRQVSGVIAISREIEEECLECGIPSDRVHRIPNGVDIRHFQPVADDQQKLQLRQELAICNVSTVVFAGSLVRRKRPHLLIDAVARLQQQDRHWQVLLVGPEHDQAYASQLRQSVTKYGIQDRIHFLGMQSDIRPFLHAADVFCLPSENEGMPNAVLEAMACGLPSVVTKTSGVYDLLQLDGVCGKIVAADGDAIAEAIMAYHPGSAEGFADGNQARSKTVNKFSSDVVLNRTLRLFQTAMERARQN